MSVKTMAKEKRYVRKIHQQGNSLSVGIPAELVEKMELKKGEEFEVMYDEEKDEIIFRKKRKRNFQMVLMLIS